MSARHYLFDLDGTLVDSAPGIKNSIRYALTKFGLPMLSDEAIYTFIGPPLLDSFQRQCGVSGEDAWRLVNLYRERFSEKGLFENTVYDGIPELLSALQKRGATICLATSKPEEYAKRILEHFDLSRYFTFIGGSTMDEKRTAKEEVIAYVLESAGLRGEDCFMIGDRRYDVEGGRALGLTTVGVLFGYGDREELKEADHLIETPSELLLLS